MRLAWTNPGEPRPQPAFPEPFPGSFLIAGHATHFSVQRGRENMRRRRWLGVGGVQSLPFPISVILLGMCMYMGRILGHHRKIHLPVHHPRPALLVIEMLARGREGATIRRIGLGEMALGLGVGEFAVAAALFMFMFTLTVEVKVGCDTLGVIVGVVFALSQSVRVMVVVVAVAIIVRGV